MVIPEFSVKLGGAQAKNRPGGLANGSPRYSGTPGSKVGGVCNWFMTSKLQSWLRNFVMNIIHPNDNRFALKLFGSKTALQKEKIRCVQNPWIIHPYSVFRLVINSEL